LSIFIVFFILNFFTVAPMFFFL